MEARWHQNRSKIDVNFEKRFFGKAYSLSSEGSIFEIPGVQVGRKNQSKIDQKTESKMEHLLASIFERFWWILGGKLGGKIDQNSIKNGIEKTMKK